MMIGERGGMITRLIFLLFIAAFLIVLYLARHPLLRFAANEWIVEDVPAHCDAMIVLSDDDYAADRANRAAQLYRSQAAPIVVASGRMLRPYAGIGELMQHDLVERGVPQTAIIVFKHTAENTREEAEAVRSLVQDRGWKRLLVVTSNYHTRRARYIFSRVLPAAQVYVASAPDTGFDPNNWWEHRYGVKMFFYELTGMCVSMWELRHAPSPASTSAIIGLKLNAAASLPV
jgi:uncharacterized SAM-binding protein YcdF (DUF218 family)